jgi:hypothetical protein
MFNQTIELLAEKKKSILVKKVVNRWQFRRVSI